MSLQVYIINAYEDLGMTRKDYALKYILPAVGLALLFSLSMVLLFPDILINLTVYVVIVLFPVYIFLALFLYPVAKFQSRKMDIDREMLLFMIRMSVLAEADMPKKDMFDILGEMKEFGELGIEIHKIHKLVNTWNTNLGDACRLVSNRTPSSLFADFLDRLAHAIDTGDEPRDFFKREQRAFKNNYEVEYRGMLFKLEILIELFIAIIIIVFFFRHHRRHLFLSAKKRRTTSRCRGINRNCHVLPPLPTAPPRPTPTACLSPRFGSALPVIRGTHSLDRSSTSRLGSCMSPPATPPWPSSVSRSAA